MVKATIFMAIFNSYVKLPEGIHKVYLAIICISRSYLLIYKIL